MSKRPTEQKGSNPEKLSEHQKAREGLLKKLANLREKVANLKGDLVETINVGINRLESRIGLLENESDAKKLGDSLKKIKKELDQLNKNFNALNGTAQDVDSAAAVDLSAGEKKSAPAAETGSYKTAVEVEGAKEIIKEFQGGFNNIIKIIRRKKEELLNDKEVNGALEKARQEMAGLSKKSQQDDFEDMADTFDDLFILLEKKGADIRKEYKNIKGVAHLGGSVFDKPAVSEVSRDVKTEAKPVGVPASASAEEATPTEPVPVSAEEKVLEPGEPAEPPPSIDVVEPLPDKTRRTHAVSGEIDLKDIPLRPREKEIEKPRNREIIDIPERQLMEIIGTKRLQEVVLKMIGGDNDAAEDMLKNIFSGDFGNFNKLVKVLKERGSAYDANEFIAMWTQEDLYKWPLEVTKRWVGQMSRNWYSANISWWDTFKQNPGQVAKIALVSAAPIAANLAATASLIVSGGSSAITRGAVMGATGFITRKSKKDGSRIGNWFKKVITGSKEKIAEGKTEIEARKLEEMRAEISAKVSGLEYAEMLSQALRDKSATFALNKEVNANAELAMQQVKQAIDAEYAAVQQQETVPAHAEKIKERQVADVERYIGKLYETQDIEELLQQAIEKDPTIVNAFKKINAFKSMDFDALLPDAVKKDPKAQESNIRLIAEAVASTAAGAGVGCALAAMPELRVVFGALAGGYLGAKYGSYRDRKAREKAFVNEYQENIDSAQKIIGEYEVASRNTDKFVEFYHRGGGNKIHEELKKIRVPLSLGLLESDINLKMRAQNTARRLEQAWLSICLAENPDATQRQTPESNQSSKVENLLDMFAVDTKDLEKEQKAVKDRMMQKPSGVRAVSGVIIGAAVGAGLGMGSLKLQEYFHGQHVSEAPHMGHAATAGGVVSASEQSTSIGVSSDHSAGVHSDQHLAVKHDVLTPDNKQYIVPDKKGFLHVVNQVRKDHPELFQHKDGTPWSESEFRHFKTTEIKDWEHIGAMKGATVRVFTDENGNPHLGIPEDQSYTRSPILESTNEADKPAVAGSDETIEPTVSAGVTPETIQFDKNGWPLRPAGLSVKPIVDDKGQWIGREYRFGANPNAGMKQGLVSMVYDKDMKVPTTPQEIAAEYKLAHQRYLDSYKSSSQQHVEQAVHSVSAKGGGGGKSDMLSKTDSTIVLNKQGGVAGRIPVELHDRMIKEIGELQYNQMAKDGTLAELAKEEGVSFKSAVAAPARETVAPKTNTAEHVAAHEPKHQHTGVKRGGGAGRKIEPDMEKPNPKVIKGKLFTAEEAARMPNVEKAAGVETVDVIDRPFTIAAIKSDFYNVWDQAVAPDVMRASDALDVGDALKYRIELTLESSPPELQARVYDILNNPATSHLDHQTQIVEIIKALDLDKGGLSPEEKLFAGGDLLNSSDEFTTIPAGQGAVFDGEKIEKFIVSTNVNGAHAIRGITETGKEVFYSDPDVLYTEEGVFPLQQKAA